MEVEESVNLKKNLIVKLVDVLGYSMSPDNVDDVNNIRIMMISDQENCAYWGHMQRLNMVGQLYCDEGLTRMWGKFNEAKYHLIGDQQFAYMVKAR